MATYTTATSTSEYGITFTRKYPKTATEGETVTLTHVAKNNSSISNYSTKVKINVSFEYKNSVTEWDSESATLDVGESITSSDSYTIPVGATSIKCCFDCDTGTNADVDTGSDDSAYVYTCTVAAANVAPTAPSTITVSDNPIGGQACTVSWSAGSDTDGNLEGYTVQRSVDGGTTWTQIYQGTARTTSNTIPWGSETVIYRVRAYDTGDLTSGWTTSAEVDVFNNSAPTAPATLTLPAVLCGGQANTIAWTAGGDADGNLVGYILQFSADGGDFADIYTGSALTYAHTPAQGLTSAQYRVCAYDAYDATSDWTTATASEIVNNNPPVITVDDYDSGDDLGTITTAPSFTYQVADADGDSVTCTYTLDGAEIGTASPDLDTDTVLTWTADDWQQVRNGDHAVQISADDGTATGTFALTFTKMINSLAVTLLSALSADAQITVCALSVLGSIPADADFCVLVTNNGDADSPTWEDATSAVQGGSNYIFVNAPTSGHAFSFKINVSVGDSGAGGYITAVQGGFQ